MKHIAGKQHRRNALAPMRFIADRSRLIALGDFCNVLHAPLDRPFAVSPDDKSVAISNRRGVAVWETATDAIRFPLKDPKRKPLPYPMQP